jgi:hypothetical protein
MARGDSTIYVGTGPHQEPGVYDVRDAERQPQTREDLQRLIAGAIRRRLNHVSEQQALAAADTILAICTPRGW